ncbi:MAG: hypothetical protein V3R60_00590 [Acidobacteriota bacterium]
MLTVGAGLDNGERDAQETGRSIHQSIIPAFHSPIVPLFAAGHGVNRVTTGGP